MEGDGGGKDDDDGGRGMSGGEMDEVQVHTQHFICPSLSTSRLKTSRLLC